MIYLDNASTTKIDPVVLEEMMPYLKEEYGNPGSIHYLGIRARDAVKLARERVARAINAEPEEIIFTSGGTESNNLAMKLASDFWGFRQSIVATSATEHNSMKRAIGRYSVRKIVYPTYDSPEELLRRIKKEKKLSTITSFMYVNNELGFVNPVYKICEYCTEELGGISIVDAVQALGIEEIDVKHMMCDFLSISSHKIHGPKGIGALYIRKDFKDRYCPNPLILGGEFQEFGLRGGTENVAGIVGFGKACELINVEENKNTISELRKEFVNGLKFDHKINYDREDSKIISLTIPGVDAETLVLMLSSMNVYISAGSACKSLEQKPNEVLLSAGMSEDEARNTVRISLSTHNTIEEMRTSSNVLKTCVDLLK